MFEKPAFKDRCIVRIEFFFFFFLDPMETKGDEFDEGEKVGWKNKLKS